MKTYELNIDGLVGPTHNYAGLGLGNIASINNAQSMSNPQAAALQGLDKIRLLHNLGLKQAVFPPHPRPNLALLHQLGFKGTPSQQVTKAYRENPQLLSIAYSSASMWAANAATVSASCDTMNGKVHFTAANLISNLHRQSEAAYSKKLLEYVFNNEKHFQHHAVLPPSFLTSDEGAANHNRLCASHNKPGINLFVYGIQGLENNPSRFQARQSFEASQAIARIHQLYPQNTLFAQQNPRAIDAGVFHNDVIAIANENFFLFHEAAFMDQKAIKNELQKKADFNLILHEIKNNEMSLDKAVESYLFNSQIITISEGNMCLIAPAECEKDAQVKGLIDSWIANPSLPINKVYFVDLKQSIRNGGGPACLRLRVPLTTHEFHAMHQGILVTDNLLDALTQCIKSDYRTELYPKDLANPELIDESFRVIEKLNALLNLPPGLLLCKNHTL